ncbi:unnamed protein product [Rhizopus stolonifer]
MGFEQVQQFSNQENKSEVTKVVLFSWVVNVPQDKMFVRAMFLLPHLLLILSRVLWDLLDYKMLVDEIGDVTITNDGATILQLLEVEHPAGKVLVELAQQQDREVGDGTTSVVIIAAELLKRANELVKNKIHPTTIITGYQLASKEACRFIANECLPK